MEIQSLINRVFNNLAFNKIICTLNKDFELKIKSLVMTYLLMMRSADGVLEFTEYLLVMINESNFKLNHTPSVIDFIFSKIPSEGLADMIIENYIKDGYYFRSVNAAFRDSIENNGLLLKHDVWDYSELETIRTIFAKQGKKDIFGSYLGEAEPIYTSANLNSSPYYGISSPGWFLHFTSGGWNKDNALYDKEAYRRRDYNACLNNIITMCQRYSLTELEKNIVLDFFNKYYGLFGTKEEPLVVFIKKSKFSSQSELIAQGEAESDCDYVKRTVTLYANGDKIIRSGIAKEDIILIDYKSKERVINL